jgi:hypothetical protein
MMLLGIDTGDLCPGALFVRKICVAANTECAAAINVQPHGISGVIIIGTVAVFATYGAMGRILDIVILVLMAFPADFGGLVFDRELLPLGFVRLAVPAIHVAPLIHAEVIWD